MPPQPPATPTDRLREGATAFAAWLCRPRVRLTMTGLALLLAGTLVLDGSVWTLPLVIAGTVMVVVAWIGHRLDGRLAVQWGQAGTELEFRARIKPTETAPPIADAEVVEAEAHTVEIEVTALKALLAAAETAEAAEAEPGPSLRVARAADAAS